MAKSEFWLTPLAGLLDRLPKGLSEVQMTSQINLRGNPDDPVFLCAVEDIIGVALPLMPNTTAVNEDLRALWLGPDEWLIVFDMAPESLLQKFDDLARDQHVSIVDVGANRVVVELSSPHSIDILMKSCEMDFHPSVFKPGQVVQTLIAKSQAIVEQVEAGRFHIYIRNSFSHYVVEWLIDANLEFEG